MAAFSRPSFVHHDKRNLFIALLETEISKRNFGFQKLCILSIPHAWLCTKNFLFKPYNSVAPIFQMWKLRHWERAEPGLKTKQFYSIVHIFYHDSSLLSIIQGPSTHKLYGFKMKSLVKIPFGLHYKKAKQNLLPWIKSFLVFTPGRFSSLIYGHSASLFFMFQLFQISHVFLCLNFFVDMFLSSWVPSLVLFPDLTLIATSSGISCPKFPWLLPKANLRVLPPWSYHILYVCLDLAFTMLHIHFPFICLPFRYIVSFWRERTNLCL